MGMVNIVKVRSDCVCLKCKKKINKGNYCWGNGWDKFCIDCGFKVGEDLIKHIDNLIKQAKKMEKEYKQNNIVENL